MQPGKLLADDHRFLGSADGETEDHRAGDADCDRRKEMRTVLPMLGFLVSRPELTRGNRCSEAYRHALQRDLANHVTKDGVVPDHAQDHENYGRYNDADRVCDNRGAQLSSGCLARMQTAEMLQHEQDTKVHDDEKKDAYARDAEPAPPHLHRHQRRHADEHSSGYPARVGGGGFADRLCWRKDVSSHIVRNVTFHIEGKARPSLAITCFWCASFN